MSQELETAAAISLGGLFRRGKHHETLPLDSPCPNCATPLKGGWCFACGQIAEDFHRSTAKLVLESLQEVFDFDNRAWKTLPQLILRPGRLTRSYLDGHRVPQVPPLRLFLVVLLLLFLVGISGGGVPKFRFPALNEKEALTEVQNDKRIPPEEKKEILKDIQTAKTEQMTQKETATVAWIKARLNYVDTHRNEFVQALENWAERFAFLMLPLAALLMSLLFAFQRQFFLYDHIIFSMHSLSFLCLLLTAWIVWGRYGPFDLGATPLLVASAHLFFHMRGVYATSILGTLARMSLLFFGSVVGAVFIVLGLVWVALAAI
jgi:Protein of unknown function (DUF3667)